MLLVSGKAVPVGRQSHHFFSVINGFLSHFAVTPGINDETHLFPTRQSAITLLIYIPTLISCMLLATLFYATEDVL